LPLIGNRTPHGVFLVGIALLESLSLVALPRHAAPSVPANEIILVVDPAKSKVDWTLGSTLHTVHGTFAFKNGTIHLDPATGKAGGEIVADATSGKTDNDSRDKKMHKEVLESQRYPDVIFRPDRVDGNISPRGSFSAQIHGVFVLHGAEHELSLPIQAEFSGDRWSGSGKFSVPFIDWGLKNPSNFLLRVNHAVDIETQLVGNLQSSPAK